MIRRKRDFRDIHYYFFIYKDGTANSMHRCDDSIAVKLIGCNSNTINTRRIPAELKGARTWGTYTGFRPKAWPYDLIALKISLGLDYYSNKFVRYLRF